jgi:hypothetical protein
MGADPGPASTPGGAFHAFTNGDLYAGVDPSDRDALESRL